MNDISELVSLIDFMLDTRSKRHIVGGVLLSLSFLFGGLAITAMTMTPEEKKEESIPVNDIYTY